MMYSFPVATAIYYYKLGNLKQQKCIISQSEGQKSEIKVLAGPPASRGSGRESVPCLSALVTASVLGLWLCHLLLCVSLLCVSLS